MKRFARFVGKMPFAGKFCVKRAIMDVVSSRTPTMRFISALSCLMILTLLTLLHGFQAWLGVRLIIAPVSLFARGVGAIFAVTNLLVTVTQAYLLYRVVKFLIRRRGKYRRRGATYRSHFAVWDYLLSFAVTLGGQILFLSQARGVVL